MAINHLSPERMREPNFAMDPKMEARNMDQYNQHSQYQLQRQMTLNELLQEHRIIFLDFPITPEYGTDQGPVASMVIKRLLYLDNLKRNSDIHFYINSPGGDVDDMFAIYDTMQFISSDVCTYCVGHAASAAAVLLAAGAKKKRYALPNSRIMLHQLTGYIGGQAADVKIAAAEHLRRKKLIAEILSKHTGQPVERILEETERNKWMTAEQAREYGLIDEVLHEEEEKKGKDEGKKDEKKD